MKQSRTIVPVNTKVRVNEVQGQFKNVYAYLKN